LLKLPLNDYVIQTIILNSQLHGETMPLVNKRIQLQCVIDNLDDAQQEIVQLKMVIGLIIAKLPPEQREDIIHELRNFGLNSSAQEFTQFVVE